ncbi:hypothetical protein F2P79_010185 [Pimephales promelas]|nr:hypothetical protein F2P79_010185 [Pimephales promelas]
MYGTTLKHNKENFTNKYQKERIPVARSEEVDVDQGGCPSTDSSIEVLQTQNTSSKSLLNFLNHLHQTERFDDVKSILITALDEPVSRKEILVAILSLPQSESLAADGLTLLLMTDHRSQGLRVGCPLTPLLVSICLLPLIYSINCENRKLGPKVQGETLKSVVDRDTALVILSDCKEGLDSFKKMLNDFIETSGFVIDEQYSEVFIAGPSGFSLSKDKLMFFKRTGDGFCGEEMVVEPS